MPHRPQFRLAFKPAAKLAFVAPPKLHLFRVEIVTGFHAGLVYDTSRPMTRQATYEAATSVYGNERPLITLTTIDPITPAAWVAPPPVAMAAVWPPVPKPIRPAPPAWFVAQFEAWQRYTPVDDYGVPAWEFSPVDPALRQARLDKAHAEVVAQAAAREARLAAAREAMPAKCKAPRTTRVFSPTDDLRPPTAAECFLSTAMRRLDMLDMDPEALMGNVAEFDWTADEMGFNAYGYRSGFSIAR